MTVIEEPYDEFEQHLIRGITDIRLQHERKLKPWLDALAASRARKGYKIVLDQAEASGLNIPVPPAVTRNQEATLNVDAAPTPLRRPLRGIGFDADMYLDRMQETLFFFPERFVDDPPGLQRITDATEEEVNEFIRYYEHQISVAREYLRNGRNPRTNEWTKEPDPCTS